MPCDRDEEARLLHAYEEAADEHVKLCPDCSREVEEIRRIREIYRSEGRPEPMPGGIAPRRSRITTFAALAAAALVAVTGWFLVTLPVEAPPATVKEPTIEKPIEPVHAWTPGPQVDREIRTIRHDLARLEIDDDAF